MAMWIQLPYEMTPTLVVCSHNDKLYADAHIRKHIYLKDLIYVQHKNSGALVSLCLIISKIFKFIVEQTA